MCLLTHFGTYVHPPPIRIDYGNGELEIVTAGQYSARHKQDTDQVNGAKCTRKSNNEIKETCECNAVDRTLHWSYEFRVVYFGVSTQRFQTNISNLIRHGQDSIEPLRSPRSIRRWLHPVPLQGQRTLRHRSAEPAEPKLLRWNLQLLLPHPEWVILSGF